MAATGGSRSPLGTGLHCDRFDIVLAFCHMLGADCRNESHPYHRAADSCPFSARDVPGLGALSLWLARADPTEVGYEDDHNRRVRLPRIHAGAATG